jgi:hypothetical protein
MSTLAMQASASARNPAETKAGICLIPQRSASVQHLFCALTFVRVPSFTVFVFFCIQDTCATIVLFPRRTLSLFISNFALRTATKLVLSGAALCVLVQVVIIIIIIIVVVVVSNV